MKEPKNKLLFVGVLQDFGVPFTSLYVDITRNLLYLFVNLCFAGYGNDEYAITTTSPSRVRGYMNEELGLNDLFTHGEAAIASVSEDDVKIENRIFHGFPLEDSLNMFDPELCDDEIWINTVLKRIENHRPLAIKNES